MFAKPEKRATTGFRLNSERAGTPDLWLRDAGGPRGQATGKLEDVGFCRLRDFLG